MRRLIFLTVFVPGFIGCDVEEKTPGESEPLSPVFRMTDTLGHEATSFRSTEEFDVIFSVVNTSGKRLTYSRGDSSPEVTFRIFHADTVVATSTDGYAFLPVVTVGHLEVGETLKVQWRAPNTTARNPKLVLAPGVYGVQPFFVRFDEVGTKPGPPINFSVTP